MRKLSALKVVIHLNSDGSAKYPNFNSLQSMQKVATDWCAYIDAHGSGWLYDKTCGHRDEDSESPHGCQFGMLLVPDAFAQEAAEKFPETCSILNEKECEKFYDYRYAAHIEDDTEDEKALEKLERRLRLLKELEGTPHEPRNYKKDLGDLQAKISRALDPKLPMKGVRSNPLSKWEIYKATNNIELS